MNMPWHVHPLKQRETSEGTEQLAVGLSPANGQRSCEHFSYCEQALRQAQGERTEVGAHWQAAAQFMQWIASLRSQ
jgi:hypothetical protein